MPSEPRTFMQQVPVSAVSRLLTALVICRLQKRIGGRILDVGELLHNRGT